jgi:peptide deformylase
LATLPVYTYNSPVLRKRAKPIRSVDDELIRFIGDMFDTMRSANGIGLAANQVGSLRRVIVVDVSDMEEERDTKPMVLINPLVIGESGTWVMEEGCLSIPEIRENVERAGTITVVYKDIDLKEQELKADGLLARVILHEIDHLNGVLFVDHLNADQRKLLTGRLNKIRRGEFEVSYPVVVELVEAK